MYIILYASEDADLRYLFILLSEATALLPPKIGLTRFSKLPNNVILLNSNSFIIIISYA